MAPMVATTLLVCGETNSPFCSTKSVFFIHSDTARVFPAEPSWVTFKALLLPPDIRKDAWSEMERPNFLEVDLTVQNWEKEIYHILSIDYSDLPPAEKVRSFGISHVHVDWRNMA